MKLRSKLLLSFIGIASLIFVIGIVGIVASKRVTDAFETVVSSTSPALIALGQAESSATAMRASVVAYALNRFLKDDASPAVEAFELAKTRYDRAIRTYAAVVEETEYYNEISAAEENLYQLSIGLVRLADAPVIDTVAVGSQIDALESAESSFDAAITKTIDFETSEFQHELTAAKGAAESESTVFVISMIVVIGAAVVLGVLISGTIVRPVRQLQNAANRMMNGDYDQRTFVSTSDEIGELSIAFNTMAETIQQRDSDLNASNQMLEKRVDERTKELRVATREAQEASRLKDEFLSIMSHELRTPLNAIIGFQGIMLMNGHLDERGTHMIQRAQANSNRLLTLINDILDVSRIESGRLQVVKTDVSPVALVEHLESQMSVLAEQKKLEFVVQIDPTIPQQIHVDEDIITKIITNLLGNAFKFTEEGLIALTLKQSDSNLVIEVTDTGIGIPSHMHQVIFERFRQVDGSAKRAHGGSGLGLAIVQKLCIAIGGSIQVQSVVGKGSTFTVILPLEAAEEKIAS